MLSKKSCHAFFVLVHPKTGADLLGGEGGKGGGPRY